MLIGNMDVDMQNWKEKEKNRMVDSVSIKFVINTKNNNISTTLEEKTRERTRI